MCRGNCPNASVCYYLKRTRVTNRTVCSSDKLRNSILNSGAKVYESICVTDGSYHNTLLSRYRNYNITMSSSLLEYCIDIYDTNWSGSVDQIQLSVYTLKDVFNPEFEKYQKLFLIKNVETLARAYEILNTTLHSGKVHLILDQSFLRLEKAIALDLIKAHQNRRNPLVSIDTCLTSFVINGKCPYQDNNYIDISHDETLRTCPYKETGNIYNSTRNIVPEDMEEIFRVKFPENNCIFKEIFKGTNNERNKDPNLQDNTTDNGFGGSGKRMRRFSLRR
jgi:hypothetical protein